MSVMSILDENLSTTKSVEISVKKGLSQAKAEELQKQNGKNELKGAKQKGPLHIFVNQYKDILTMILLLSTTVSLLLGEYIDAIVIAMIVLLNGVMGFLQEYRTEKTLERLKQLSAPQAQVYRDGKICAIDTQDVVVGDLLLLHTGDRIPADATLTVAYSVSVDEAIITGESLPQAKSIGDQVVMGSSISTGHGEATVNAIGMDTQMGKITHLLQNVKEEPTQLQQRLKQLGKVVAWGCLGICAVVVCIGLLRGEDLLLMLLTGVSLAVAAVPEGLPAVVTVSLALAVGRMMKQNALIRKLHAVETLGCTNVICSDKTGTLTQNKMSVVTAYTAHQTLDLIQNQPLFPALEELFCCASLCNNADLAQKLGDPTELALMQIATQFAVSPKAERLSEIPFDSKTKQMAVTVRYKGETHTYSKGAPDVILNNCTHVSSENGMIPLDAVQKQSILQAHHDMATAALRVLGFAKKQQGKTCFLGLLGMIDPPRPEVKSAIAQCRQAGMKTVMITGDHLLTARAIASQIGLYQEGDQLLTGAQLDQMNDQMLQEAVKSTSVYARVSPKHKLQIVEKLQQNGNIVAMTGDGVNDAPAVKKADIGVSMGITGTDVTKEVADVTLLDDNFATLVYAVKEGRTIYSNIRKFIRYLLSCNIGEVLTMLVGLLMGMPMVLLPIHILSINLITDGLPAICLGLEPSDPSVMKRRPRKKGESVFADGLLSEIIFRGVLIAIATLGAFVLLYNETSSLSIAQTGAYVTLVLTQLINVFDCKFTDGKWSFHGLWNNPYLLWSVLLSLGILAITIYLPVIAGFFKTVPLSLAYLGICSLCAVVPSISGMFLGKSRSNR